MRIDELLESVDIDLEKGHKKEGLDFDLAGDLVYFMNHDDDTYRRNTYPAITRCLEKIKSNARTHPSIFRTAVLKSFKDYTAEFPRREIPDELDDKVAEAACKLLHDETCKHAEEGKYK